MRSIRLLALGLTAATLAACASSTPGWTYAPAPSATPIPSVDASASVAPSASTAPSESAAPSAQPSASAEPSPSGSASAGTILEVKAQNIAWDPTELTVPADVPFQIVFDNEDASIPHDLDIHEGDPAGPKVLDSAPITGVTTATLDVDALPAGIYAYVCSIHTNMVGTLTAE